MQFCIFENYLRKEQNSAMLFVKMMFLAKKQQLMFKYSFFDCAG